MTRHVRHVQTGDRQVQGIATDAQAAIRDLYNLIPPPRPARMMPVDEATDLFWPLSDPVTHPSFGNFGMVRRQGDRLIRGLTCGPSLGGLVEDGCAVLFGADATRGAQGAAGITGTSPPSGSLSAWVRIGDDGLPSSSNIVAGYYDSVGTQASMVLYFTGDLIPTFSVYTSAGQRTVAGVTSQRIAAGTWHFVTGVYNGTGLGIYIDGLNSNSTGLPYAPILWSLTAMPNAWRLGYPGSANSMHGAVQDLRMHSTVRGIDWHHEAWRRGFGLWEEVT